MKRFILQTTILLVPIFSVLVIFEIALRNVPNDYKYKNDYMEKQHDVSILVFGSSHSYFGISPQFFTKNAFNLAFTSQSLKYDKFLYDKYASDCDSLRYVILPISYFTLRSDLEASREWWRAKGYCIYMGCYDHIFDPEYMLEIASKEKMKIIKEALVGHANFRSCDNFGFGINYKKENRLDTWVSSGEVAAKRHTSIHRERVVTNLQYLHSIISSCEERGVKVLLLTTPTYNTYVESLDVLQLNEMVDICQQLDADNEHVIYLNWLQNDAFNEDDFFDADHLNEYGAEKLTKMLDEYILSW